MTNQKELRLRGFITPKDTGGDLQAAIDLAVALDVRKVVVAEDHAAKDTVFLPAGIHLVIENAVLTANLAAKAPASSSFAFEYLYIEGRNATLWAVSLCTTPITP